MYNKFGQFIDGKWKPAENKDTYDVKDYLLVLLIAILALIVDWYLRKKRGLLSTKKDIDEKEVVAKAKNIENIRKNLTNKKIIKNIFVKNKVINFIVA